LLILCCLFYITSWIVSIKIIHSQNSLQKFSSVQFTSLLELGHNIFFNYEIVNLQDCESAVCVVWKLLSAYTTNWFIRAFNQFISLLHLISLAPRFINVFQIAKTIFKGLNKLGKIFQSSIHPPSWTQPKTFSVLISYLLKF